MNLEMLATFDIEATGKRPHEDRIVTAFLGILDGEGSLISSSSWLVNPEYPIHPEATLIHGVTDERARAEGIPAATAVDQIALALADVTARGMPLVVMNAPYDLTMVDAEVRRHEVGLVGDIDGVGGLWWEPRPVIDPLVLDKALDTYRKGKRTLEALCAHYGIPHGDLHDAEQDALASGRLALLLAERAIGRAGGDATLDDLHEWQIAWSRRQRESFADYLLTREGPEAAVEVLASVGWPIQDRRGE